MNLAEEVRDQYPILHEGERRLVYLDSAATSLRPRGVIEAVTDALTHKSANVHRAVHFLGDIATEAYEQSRQCVADFLRCESHEIVFLRNTTEAINLIARGWKEKGRTLVSLGEHHSNLLPWQNDVCRVNPLADGNIDVDRFYRELSKGDVAIVSISHVSNVLGQRNDIAAIAKICHQHGAILVVDAAQSAPHEPLDVYKLDCDFLAFSGHKLGSPAGVGVLFGKAENFDRLDWYLHGGSTVEQVLRDRVVPKEVPWRFEAGTPALESIIGLAAAVEFLQSLGMERIHAHQTQLIRYALKQINERLPEISILGSATENRCSLVSLVQRVVSPHVLARGMSDRFGICARSGFHCAQPLHEFLSVPASLRLSFYVYNSTQDIDLAIDAIQQLLAIGT